MTERTLRRGHITIQREYSFHCGRCGTIDDYWDGKIAVAVSHARKDGWSLAQWDGWICPACRALPEKGVSR